MQIEIVVNPIAGGGKSARALETVKKILDSENETYSIHWTQFPGHGKEIASELEPRSETVVAVGGDGTVMEVLNGVNSQETKVGIIPAGMGNDLARCLNIPEDPRQATQLLSKGTTERIDLGAQADCLFNFMGVGFPSEVVKKVDGYRNGLKGGKSVYLFALLRTISSLSTYDLELVIDGERKADEASAVFVASCNYTGGGINLIPHADCRDGLLDVALIKEVGRLELIMALRKVYSGTHVNHPKIDFFRAKSVRIKSRKKLPEMLDGDIKGSTPTELTVEPGARSLIVPEKNWQKKGD